MLSKPYQQVHLVNVIPIQKRIIVLPISMTYRFVVIKERIKGQDSGSLGVKHVKMLQFCWKWFQNARLVNTIQILNSLLYVAGFVIMVMQ